MAEPRNLGPRAWSSDSKVSLWSLRVWTDDQHVFLQSNYRNTLSEIIGLFQWKDRFTIRQMIVRFQFQDRNFKIVTLYIFVTQSFILIFDGNITVIVDHKNSYYIMKCYFLNLTRWTWRLKLTKVCKFVVVLVVNRGSTVVYATLHSFSTSSKFSKSAFLRLNFFYFVQSRPNHRTETIRS